MNLPTIDAQLVFAVLGPLFLVLGTFKLWGHKRNVIQARIWLLVGAIFCAVALLLRSLNTL